MAWVCRMVRILARRVGYVLTLLARAMLDEALKRLVTA